jgi:nitroreductase
LAIVVTADTTKSDAWIEDASIAAMLMQLQAEDFGLGSCWVEVRERFGDDGVPAEEYVREALGIPEEFGVLCIISIGYKDEQRKPINPDKLLWEKVHVGRWSNSAE